MEGQGRILMVVTSHDAIDAAHPTGLWLEEFAVPYDEFRAAGHDVIVASPRGGPIPIDPNSEAGPDRSEGWADARQVLQNTMRLDQTDHAGFDALFLPGGHGTMFDFPDNGPLQRMIGAFDRAGQIIAAVCHGPAAFVNVLRPDQRSFVEGRRLTAFTNDEEREVGLVAEMPFLLQSKLEAEGAHFIARANWADHVEQDGNLITGQNPQSSLSAARAVLRAMQQGTRKAAA